MVQVQLVVIDCVLRGLTDHERGALVVISIRMVWVRGERRQKEYLVKRNLTRPFQIVILILCRQLLMLLRAP